MILDLLMLFGGFLLLLRGADMLVAGASSLARKLGVSALVVGLTVVAFGTSAPELFVNLFAITHGQTDIAVGNVLGSNIANILLILGLSAVITPVAVGRTTAWKEIPFAMLAVALVFVLGNDIVFNGFQENALTRTDGIVLLSFFCVFLYYVFGMSRGSGERGSSVETYSGPKTAGYILGGLLGLGIGGPLIVEGVGDIARMAGISEHIIAMTVVAVGTSLPELATSVVAARKGQSDMAIGNVVGSNIFNVFLILGLSATIQMLPFSTLAVRDAGVALGVTVLLFLALFVGSRHRFERWQGATFVVGYLAYIGYVIFA